MCVYVAAPGDHENLLPTFGQALGVDGGWGEPNIRGTRGRPRKQNPQPQNLRFYFSDTENANRWIQENGIHT